MLARPLKSLGPAAEKFDHHSANTSRHSQCQCLSAFKGPVQTQYEQQEWITRCLIFMGFTVVQIAGSHLNLPVLAADVCEHTGFTDLAIELVTTIFPNYPKKLHNFESC